MVRFFWGWEQIESTFWNFPTFKAESKKLESLNRHLLTEKDEQQELVEFVQIEKEEFAKDLQSLKVNYPFRKTHFEKPLLKNHSLKTILQLYSWKSVFEKEFLKEEFLKKHSWKPILEKKSLKSILETAFLLEYSWKKQSWKSII